MLYQNGCGKKRIWLQEPFGSDFFTKFASSLIIITNLEFHGKKMGVCVSKKRIHLVLPLKKSLWSRQACPTCTC